MPWVKQLAGLEAFCNSPLFNEALNSLKLVSVTLERRWVLVLSTKFTLVFGSNKQPIPGTLLVFHPGTGEYFVTVFSKVINSQKKTRVAILMP